MARVKISTPVTDHSGVVGNVYITDGVAYADTVQHAAEIAYCRANGYTVEDLDAPEAVELEEVETDDEAEDDEQPGDDRLPRRNGSAEAWRAYAVTHGMTADEAEALTRDQLVERFTSTEESDS